MGCKSLPIIRIKLRENGNPTAAFFSFGLKICLPCEETAQLILEDLIWNVPAC